MDVLRRELRRVSPDAKIEAEEILKVLQDEVLKRDVLDGEKAISAKKVVARAGNRALRAKPSSDETPQAPAATSAIP